VHGYHNEITIHFLVKVMPEQDCVVCIVDGHQLQNRFSILWQSTNSKYLTDLLNCYAAAELHVLRVGCSGLHLNIIQIKTSTPHIFQLIATPRTCTVVVRSKKFLSLMGIYL